MHAFPCSIQKRRVSSSGEDSVSGSHLGWEKKVGLKSGTEIKIPQKKKVNVQTLTVNDSLPKLQKENKPTFSVHVVEKGETLYSISRSYGI